MAPPKELDVASFSEKARKDLLRLLETVTGKKTLVLAKSLVGSIDLLVKFSTLQEYGVDRVFFLENDNVESSLRHVVFLASGDKPQQASAIATQIKRLQNTSQTDHDFTVIWVPRRTIVGDKTLEEAGILGDVNALELPLYFQALEDDLISMELEDSFSDLYLYHDPTCIFTAAKALSAIQQRHGLFPHIIGKGDHARRLADLLMRMRSEVSADISTAPNGVPHPSTMPSTSIESLIIIDREVDFASVLLTQLTYEGLIDETFGIRHGQTELDSSILGPIPSQANGSSTAQPGQSLKRKIKLDSSDKLFTSLRDVNFVVVGSLLNKIARRLQSDYDTKAGPQKTVSELRDFVSKLPGYQAEQASLKLHTSLTEEIMKQTSSSEIFGRALEIQQNLVAGADPSTCHADIEELIDRGAPLATVLRLLCLESCIAGGLKQKDFDSFRRQLLHAYGHKHLLTLAALEKMQLFELRSSSNAAAVATSMVTSSLAYIPGTSILTTASTQTAATASEPTLQKTAYSSIRRPLHLILDTVSEQNPQDIAYVYSGYAPLSVRLVQCILQKGYLTGLGSRSANTTQQTPQAPSTPRSNAAATAAAAAPTAPPNAAASLDAAAGWRPFESAVHAVRGATVHVAQPVTDAAAKARAVLGGHGRFGGASKQVAGSGGGGGGGGGTGQGKGRGARKTTLVFFLGGITFAEIAALRFVGRQMEEERVGREGAGVGRRVVVATTGIISGDAVVQAALEGR